MSTLPFPDLGDLDDLDELLEESTRTVTAETVDDLDDLDQLLAESTDLANARRAKATGRKLSAEQSALLESNTSPPKRNSGARSSASRTRRSSSAPAVRFTKVLRPGMRTKRSAINPAAACFVFRGLSHLCPPAATTPSTMSAPAICASPLSPSSPSMTSTSLGASNDNPED